eukprot:GFUD01048201.1.p1 GENE.GFUD01048201.1~~GFUD01048201.1.p1  ORF type:complete len:304 (+),score=48.95 GFUD01048201.1:30-941(+)
MKNTFYDFISRFVLTAAHCVPESRGIDVNVILGEHSIRDKSESRKLRIKAQPPFLVHNQYEKNIQAGYVIFDFTLLRLSQQVNFKLYPHIRPVCLPDRSYTDYQGEYATAVGWGYTKVDFAISGNLIEGIDSSPSDALQKIDIRLYRQNKCEDIFQSLDIKIKDINMCAASQQGDACGGDSGGGLVKKSSLGGFYEIVGVISYGIGCRSSFNGQTLPGVYARVSSVVDWIERQTSSGQSCKKPTATEQHSEQHSSSGWGEWTSFTKCNKACGIGNKSRDRHCEGTGCTHAIQTQDRPCIGNQC